MQSNDLKTFFQNLGLITLYSQCIECDLKKIYAGMANGDFQINLGEVEEATLDRSDHAISFVFIVSIFCFSGILFNGSL